MKLIIKPTEDIYFMNDLPKVIEYLPLKLEIIEYIVNKNFTKDSISKSASRKIENRNDYFYYTEEDPEAFSKELYVNYKKGVVFSKDNTRVLIMFNNEEFCSVGCCISNTKEFEIDKINLEDFIKSLNNND